MSTLTKLVFVAWVVSVGVAYSTMEQSDIVKTDWALRQFRHAKAREVLQRLSSLWSSPDFQTALGLSIALVLSLGKDLRHWHRVSEQRRLERQRALWPTENPEETGSRLL